MATHSRFYGHLHPRHVLYGAGIFTRDMFFMERETGFEPATSTLARLHSTAELFPRVVFYNINLSLMSRLKERSEGNRGRVQRRNGLPCIAFPWIPVLNKTGGDPEKISPGTEAGKPAALHSLFLFQGNLKKHAPPFHRCPVRDLWLLLRRTTTSAIMPKETSIPSINKTSSNDTCAAILFA